MYQTIEELFDSITPDEVDHFFSLFNQRLSVTSPLRTDITELSCDEKIERAWQVIADYPRIIERMVVR